MTALTEGIRFIAKVNADQLTTWREGTIIPWGEQGGVIVFKFANCVDSSVDGENRSAIQGLGKTGSVVVGLKNDIIFGGNFESSGQKHQ